MDDVLFNHKGNLAGATVLLYYDCGFDATGFGAFMKRGRAGTGNPTHFPQGNSAFEAPAVPYAAAMGRLARMMLKIPHGFLKIGSTILVDPDEI
jgi:hypothetical protein